MKVMKCVSTSRSVGTADWPDCAAAVCAASKKSASSSSLARSSPPIGQSPCSDPNAENSVWKGCGSVHAGTFRLGRGWEECGAAKDSPDKGSEAALNLSKDESAFRAYGPSEGRLSNACSRPIDPQALGICTADQTALTSIFQSTNPRLASNRYPGARPRHARVPRRHSQSA